MKDRTIISNQIDQLAEKACRMMTKSERMQFFKDTNCRTTYLHGHNVGKERKPYYVDGKYFNEIWKLVYPYVFTSCARSVYYESFEIEDSVSNVKYRLFRVLQLFGPVFRGKSLSQRLGVIVNMTLTNEFNKRKRSLQVDSLESINEEDEAETVEVKDFQSNMDCIDLWLSIPQKLQDAVKQLISGNSFAETSKNCNTSPARLKKELQVVISNF